MTRCKFTLKLREAFSSAVFCDSNGASLKHTEFNVVLRLTTGSLLKMLGNRSAVIGPFWSCQRSCC
jgi:hypothetical protein